jgi:hypothetical protein
MGWKAMKAHLLQTLEQSRAYWAHINAQQE